MRCGSATRGASRKVVDSGVEPRWLVAGCELGCGETIALGIELAHGATPAARRSRSVCGIAATPAADVWPRGPSGPGWCPFSCPDLWCMSCGCLRLPLPRTRLRGP